MGCGGSKLANASLVSNKDGKSIQQINNNDHKFDDYGSRKQSQHFDMRIEV